MSEHINHGRRRFLRISTGAVAGGGLVMASVPFFRSWLPSASARAASAPVTQSLKKIEPGQQLIVTWRNLPIFIVNRTRKQLAALPGQNGRLADPRSDGDSAHQQPAYAQNETRSIKPQWLVLVGLCTHVNCVPSYKGQMKPQPFDPKWQGGYYCPCHRSRYDMAGRVYRDVPAPMNMQVPPYHFVDDHTVKIGVDPKEAA